MQDKDLSQHSRPFSLVPVSSILLIYVIYLSASLTLLASTIPESLLCYFECTFILSLHLSDLTSVLVLWLNVKGKCIVSKCVLHLWQMTVLTQHALAMGGVCQALVCVNVGGEVLTATAGMMQPSSACRTVITMATLTWRVTSVFVTLSGRGQSAVHVSTMPSLYKS